MHISDHCTPPPLASLPPTGRESGGKGKGVGGGKSKFVSDDSMKEYRRLPKAAQRAEAAGEADAGVKRAAFRNHAVDIGRSDFCADGSVHKFADLRDGIRELHPRFCNKRGVRRDAINQTRRGKGLDFADIRRIDKEFHEA